MIPILIPVGPAPGDIGARVQQLESALGLAFGLLQGLVERLESKLGPGFLGPELQRLAAGAADARQQAAEIDALLGQGQRPAAARLVRELTGLTWDQAHALLGGWSFYSVEQRVRWLQLAAWVKAVSAPAGGAAAGASP